MFATTRLDQGWANTRDAAKPDNMPPTSHVENARINLEWKHKSAWKIVQGRKGRFSIPLTLVIGGYSTDILVPAVDLSNRFGSSSSPKSGGSVNSDDGDYEEAEGVRKNYFEETSWFQLTFPNRLRYCCIINSVRCICCEAWQLEYGRGERVNVLDDDSDDMFVSSFDQDK